MLVIIFASKVRDGAGSFFFMSLRFFRHVTIVRCAQGCRPWRPWLFSLWWVDHERVRLAKGWQFPRRVAFLYCSDLGVCEFLRPKTVRYRIRSSAYPRYVPSKVGQKLRRCSRMSIAMPVWGVFLADKLLSGGNDEWIIQSAWHVSAPCASAEDVF